VVAYLGGLALVASLILLLVQVVGIKAWLAALLVGAVLAIAGFVMLRRGLADLKRVDPTPRRTVQTIKEDLAVVREEFP
jgi:phosphatidylglycerophosphate synthase